jgi:hypothetical protein
MMTKGFGSDGDDAIELKEKCIEVVKKEMIETREVLDL